MFGEEVGVQGLGGVKFRPQTSAVCVIDHPRLDELVRRAEPRSLVTVTAGPGWGKTTFAAQWAAHAGASWCTLDAGDRDARRLARVLAAAHPGTAAIDPDTDHPGELAEQVLGCWSAAGPVRVVLDDGHLLTGSTGLELLRELRTAVGDQAQLVLVSREDLGLVSPRDRANASVLEIDATHLVLDTDRVEELLEVELTPDRALAARLVDATGGWPAAIRLTVEALHEVPPGERSAQVPALTGADGPIGAYVRGVLLPATGDPTERLLTQLALVGDGDDGRLAAVLGTSPARAHETTTELIARGLARCDPRVRGPRRLVIPPAVRHVMVDRVLPERPDRDELVDEVVDGLLDDGDIGRSLAVLTSTDRTGRAAEMLERHGEELINSGELDVVCAAAAALPDDRRTERIELLHGQALAFRGEWAAALRCLDAAGAEGDGPLSSEIALSVGMVHHLRGDLDTAIASYARGEVADPHGPGQAALLAWRSTAHWLRGEVDDARRLAAAAVDAANATGDDRALGLAHTATAMVAASDGDRRANELHYDLALTAARRAGDALQQSRILTNLGSRHLENGDYDTALEETDAAIDLAERQGFAMILGVARCNRAEILLRTGRLDEAIADAETARDTFARIGSRLESYAHHLLGDARREQGDLVLARLAYERALRLSRPSGDRQGQVPALIGLARTLVRTDPDGAAEVCAQADELDDGMATVEVRLATAWVALARDEPEVARRIATEARAEADRRENRAGIAESLTLLALLGDDPATDLEEAARLWSQVGARISATRAALGSARRSTTPVARTEAETLERRLVEWGCSPNGGAFAHRAVVGFERRSRPAIRVLGAFVVERDGRPVARAEWGSRKARELLKVLVVRGGRSITREELAEQLWPGEAYETVANRLSVALSVVRGVLTGEGQGRDEVALRTDDTAVAIDTEQVDVDVMRFRRLADAGLGRARTADRDGALELLLAAEEAYGGDLLEDDRDVLWLVDRREELRSLYISVARTAAELVAEDDPDRSMRLLLRVLDRDPYDEPAHLGVCRALLRSGRHGEARRRHRLYANRMSELDLPAVPLHDLVRRREPATHR